MSKSKRGGRRSMIIDKVADYMLSRVDSVVSIEELEREFPDRSRSVLQNIMQRLPGRSLEVDVVTRGRRWICRGATKKEEEPEPEVVGPAYFEMLGKTKEGALILQCELGELYRAELLK